MANASENTSPSRIWEPGFEGDRRIVVARLGPFLRIYQSPRHFVKRFFHAVYDLTIQDWQILTDQQLFGGMCTVRVDVSIQFLPTLKYVKRHLDALPDVAEHIKFHYEGLLRDGITEELSAAEENQWIPDGLTDIENRIEDRINETLIVQNIQCRARCRLDPVFRAVVEDEEAALSGYVRYEAVYLDVMRQNHEFRDKRNHERFRQLEHDEETRLVHERKTIEQQRRDEELQLEKGRKETEQLRMMLEEEERRQATKLSHASRRQRMELDAAMNGKEESELTQLRREEELQREKDIKEMERLKMDLEEEGKRHAVQLEHASRLKQMEAAAEMKDRDERMREKLAYEEKLQRERGRKETERLKTAMEEEEKQQAVRLLYASRMKRAELDAEMKDKERHHEATMQADVLLRREIELLVLEKQRAMLDKEIHEAKRGHLIPQLEDRRERSGALLESGDAPE